MVFFCIPCLVLVAYFLIAAIFFPHYRTYLKEAWRCFLDKIKGKRCSFSFDNKMRLALSMWLAKRGMVRLGRFLSNKRNFNLTFTIVGILFTLISIFLFILLVKFLIRPPCVDGACPV